MGADVLVRLLPAYKEEDNSTVWKAVDAVLLGLDKARGRSLLLILAFGAGSVFAMCGFCCCVLLVVVLMLVLMSRVVLSMLLSMFVVVVVVNC